MVLFPDIKIKKTRSWLLISQKNKIDRLKTEKQYGVYAYPAES